MGKGQMQEPVPPFPEQDVEAPGLEKDLHPRPRFRAPRYRAAGKLEGKVALITGGDSGIGRSVALLYAKEGAQVAIMHLPQEAPDANAIKAAIEEEGQEALLLPGDVRDPAYCQEAVQRVIDRFGHLDILVNNAAYQQSHERVEDISLDAWETTFRTNIFGYFHMVKAALPHLRRGACIINTGSITGLEGSKHLLDYSATKGAIHAFTKSLAQMLAEQGIRVNCVAPGPVWTPLNPADEQQDETTFGQDTPYGRPAQPEEIAPAYVFLASEADSSYITGEVLSLLGGETTAG